MALEAKNYDHLLGGNAKGLSDLQLKAHFTLYGGYVKKLNEIRERLATADRSAPNYSYNEFSELKRREPVAYNGTVLHELYFENLGDGSTQPNDVTKAAINAGFGSFENWVADSKAIMASGHGWLMTVYDPITKGLVNNFIKSEHDHGLFVGATPVIVLDVWEHAYFADYQTKKADYATNVLAGLNWDKIAARIAALPK
ncbi:MAG: Fe-Mn family superoxide dismutase [Deltaproteobacteria bacterium]|nr:Fe-Mn family superoxide dismutase [Deltaproteobacteria bacterium]